MPTSRKPIDGKDLTIGVLSITACILFTGLILVMMQPKPAYAFGQNDRAGDYIMLTQQISTSQEACVIIDAASRQMSVYALDGSNRQLKVLHPNIPLADMPGPGGRKDRQP